MNCAEMAVESTALLATFYTLHVESGETALWSLQTISQMWKKAFNALIKLLLGCNQSKLLVGSSLGF